MSATIVASVDARRGRVETAVRALLQALVLLPVVRWFCRPLEVRGAAGLDEAAIFVANHSSHADTALVIAALPRRARARVAAAAAADYFFSSRLKSVAVRLLVGAFPFPRKGREGVRRAAALLRDGRSLILFPEGTRSTDGTIGRFRGGVGHLAATGAPLVPVAIRGARGVLPKGRRLPRRAPVAIAFGKPIRFSASCEPDAATRRVEAEVRALHARLAPPVARPTLLARAGAFACSPAGLLVAFAWGVAEALWFPIVPDFLVAPLALACPARAFPLALTATAGSVAGGALAYLVGPVLLPAAPLVTASMVKQANAWLLHEGVAALWRQPLSGIPYKVFALQAAPHAPLPEFLALTAAARGIRIVGVGVAFATGGLMLRRALARLYGGLLALYAAGFVLGLSRVVAAWR